MDEEKNVTAPEGQEEEVVSTDDSEASEDIRLFEEEEAAESKPTEEKSEVESVDVKRVEESINEVRREQRISDFLNDPKNEDYKEFSGKIRELAKKPQAKGLTVEALANMVVPKDYWLKKGAQLASEAQKESSESYSGGRSNRDVSSGANNSGLPDPAGLSSKDFEKQAWDIARGLQP
jgi:hypothetical protein